MKYKGRLKYMGWMRPWTLETDDGEVNLLPIIEKFFVSFNGKRANHKETTDSYTLSADKNSDMEFTYVPGEYILLESVNGIGMSNVNYYLGTIFVWLSGRLIEIDIENGKHLKIVADKSEKVHGVYRVEGGNACEVCDGDEHKICQIGTSNSCIFATMGIEGFYCEKFSGMFARELLNRLANGDIRATRIGNCELLIRDKE